MMKQAKNAALNSLVLERAALFSLLQFVEKQYFILHPHLSSEYLVIHFEALECLQQNSCKDYGHFCEKVFAHLSAALAPDFILESTREKFNLLKQHFNEGGATEQDFFHFQSIHTVPEENKSGCNTSAHIIDDMAYACALYYLPQKWGDDCSSFFALQRELLCLQAWIDYFKKESCFIHSDIKRHIFLHKRKSQFFDALYQNPTLDKNTWIALHHRSLKIDSNLVLNQIKAELAQIAINIQTQEQNLKRQHCTPASGLDYVFLKTNTLYYELFPPTFTHKSTASWLLNVSIWTLAYVAIRYEAPKHPALAQYSHLYEKPPAPMGNQSLLRNLLNPG